MNRDEYELTKCIVRIPVAPELSNDVCDRFCNVFDSMTTCLVVVDHANRKNPPFFGSTIYMKAFDDPFYASYYQENIHHYEQAYIQMLAFPECKFVDGADSFPENLQDKYRELCSVIERTWGAGHQVGTYFGLSERHSCVIAQTFRRTTKIGDFLRDPRLNQYASLVSESFQVSAFFQALVERYKAVLRVVDRLLIGLAVVDRERRILVANVRWREIIDGTPSLRCVAGKVECGAGLRAAIERAFAPYTQGPASVGPAVVQLSDGVAPDRYAALVRPLHVPKDEFDRSVDAVTIVVVDTQDSRIPSLDLSTKVLGLTPAEVDTLSHILGGLTYQDVSDARGVSLETTKDHVASILGKANCRRLPQLLLKITRLDTPLAPD